MASFPDRSRQTPSGPHNQMLSHNRPGPNAPAYTVDQGPVTLAPGYANGNTVDQPGPMLQVMAKQAQQRVVKNQGSDPSFGQDRPKRKKTARACIHCQRAHVTCDAGRPCQRCVKKGCQNTCHDGVRKQAKYLRESPGDTSSTYSNSPPLFNPNAAIQVPQVSAQVSSPPGFPPSPPSSRAVNTASTTGLEGNSTPQLASNASAIPMDNSILTSLHNYDFGSKAANLEYSILSNMLLSTGPGKSRRGPSSTISDNSDMLSQNSTTPPEGGMGSPHNGFQIQAPQQQQQQRQQQQQQRSIAAELFSELNSDSAFSSSNQHPEEIYSSVTAPFPYTQGYHALISYLRSRFDRKHLIHMARAMAAYRPSFIATTKTLKEEDLIFMEKCFQRTLLEFQKFIDSSGTPTVVWRRTGQIAAVGKEFCILTEWPKDRLVSNQTFVVELMDDKSVTDYFDVFSRLAFGDSRGVTMTECTLLKPSGEKVPTACTWTVKRDVFDIPMMIIGNFLPILA